MTEEVCAETCIGVGVAIGIGIEPKTIVDPDTDPDADLVRIPVACYPLAQISTDSPTLRVAIESGLRPLGGIARIGGDQLLFLLENLLQRHLHEQFLQGMVSAGHPLLKTRDFIGRDADGQVEGAVGVARGCGSHAVARPGEHEDLVVRIAGYSARFVYLNGAVQQEMIARLENGL